MTLAVRVTIDSAGFERMIRTLPESVRESSSETIFNVSKMSARELRRSAMSSHRATPARMKAVQLIRAKKLSKFRAVVTMPQKLMHLDSMKPHYVALKRGRKILRWARKYWGTARVSGMSKVWRGPRGGLRGAIYVTPDPFVNKALRKIRRKLPLELRRGFKKGFRQARR